MKRILATGFIAALATFGVAGTAHAAPADAACFGQVHKTINTDGALGFTKVGDVVKTFGGQGKNEIATSLC
jgi:hypothetical protein